MGKLARELAWCALLTAFLTLVLLAVELRLIEELAAKLFVVLIEEEVDRRGLGVRDKLMLDTL